MPTTVTVTLLQCSNTKTFTVEVIVRDFKSLAFFAFFKWRQASKKYSIKKHPYPLAYDLTRREHLPSKLVSTLS